jgi:hypothetical protein
VVVSSPHFGVTRPQRPESTSSAQQDAFILPADGSSARTESGQTTLSFWLDSPTDQGLARARITYYYADAIIQSHLLEADIGSDRPLSVTTDYTMATAIPDIEEIPVRRRTSVLLNGVEGNHQILLRGGSDAAEAVVAVSFDVPITIGDKVRKLRTTLASDDIAPTTLLRTRTQLEMALRMMAPLGLDLYMSLFPVLKEQYARLDSSDLVLQVVRPTGVTLSVPWSLLYSIPIDSSFGPDFKKVPICSLISDWDGEAPLVDLTATVCPHHDQPWHRENVLCPFGFLGYRYKIEQLISTQKPVLSIPFGATRTMVVAETAYGVDQKALRSHVAELTNILQCRLPGSSVVEGSDKGTIRNLVSTDVPLIYFYCHGERSDDSSRETYLGVGQREKITAADFLGWVQSALLHDQRLVWDQVRPLVFINACHSAELDPGALFNYVDAFVGGGNAAGVIGTEVRVNSALAMQFAQRFYESLLKPGLGAGDAIQRARAEFLSRGNLFGLAYTPYCWADLKLVEVDAA